MKDNPAVDVSYQDTEDPLERVNEKGNTPGGSNPWRDSKPEDDLKSKPAIDVNSVLVLEKLREVSWNRFAFVTLLEEQFKNQGYTSAVFDQFLVDFAAQLPNLGLTEEEHRLSEHSRVAYLEHLREKEADLERLSNSSSGSSEESNEETSLSPSERDKIRLKLKQIDDKLCKRSKREIEAQRFLCKKVSRSTETIIDTYPDIGDVIESFVQESDVGADSWQRTGVYTFSGDQKKTKSNI